MSNDQVVDGHSSSTTTLSLDKSITILEATIDTIISDLDAANKLIQSQTSNLETEEQLLKKLDDVHDRAVRSHDRNLELVAQMGRDLELMETNATIDEDENDGDASSSLKRKISALDDEHGGPLSNYNESSGRKKAEMSESYSNACTVVQAETKIMKTPPKRLTLGALLEMYESSCEKYEESSDTLQNAEAAAQNVERSAHKKKKKQEAAEMDCLDNNQQSLTVTTTTAEPAQEDVLRDEEEVDTFGALRSIVSKKTGEEIEYDSHDTAADKAVFMCPFTDAVDFVDLTFNSGNDGGGEVLPTTTPSKQMKKKTKKRRIRDTSKQMEKRTKKRLIRDKESRKRRNAEQRAAVDYSFFKKNVYTCNSIEATSQPSSGEDKAVVADDDDSSDNEHGNKERNQDVSAKRKSACGTDVSGFTNTSTSGEWFAAFSESIETIVRFAPNNNGTTAQNSGSSFRNNNDVRPTRIMPMRKVKLDAMIAQKEQKAVRNAAHDDLMAEKAAKKASARNAAHNELSTERAVKTAAHQQQLLMVGKKSIKKAEPASGKKTKKATTKKLGKRRVRLPRTKGDWNATDSAKLLSLLEDIGADNEYVLSVPNLPIPPEKIPIRSFGNLNVPAFKRITTTKKEMKASIVIFTRGAFEQQVQNAPVLFSWIKRCSKFKTPFVILPRGVDFLRLPGYGSKYQDSIVMLQTVKERDQAKLDSVREIALSKFNENIDFLLHWKIFYQAMCSRPNIFRWVWFNDSLEAAVYDLFRSIRKDRLYLQIKTPPKFGNRRTKKIPYYCMPTPSSEEDKVLADLRNVINQQRAKLVVVARSPWKSLGSTRAISQIILECFDANIPTITISSSVNDTGAFVLTRVKAEHEPELHEIIGRVMKKRSVFTDGGPRNHSHNASSIACNLKSTDGSKSEKPVHSTVPATGQQCLGKDAANMSLLKSNKRMEHNLN